MTWTTLSEFFIFFCQLFTGVCVLSFLFVIYCIITSDQNEDYE